MDNLFKNPNLTIFKQHGFTPAGFASDMENVSGTCIFCGSKSSKSPKPKKTFFVNVKTKKWDCKICGKEGGYQTFLNELYTFGLENINYDRYELLSSDRGIGIKTLAIFDVGYNPIIDKYYVPSLKKDGSVMDIALYDYKAFDKRYKFISSAGTNKGLYFRKNLIDSPVVYLCEGQWDTMVMDEILRRDRLIGCSIGLPGALSFNRDFVDVFVNKEVTVLLDNDYDRIENDKVILGSGKKGSIKIYKLLKGKCKSLKFIHWDDELKNGYDVRDLYTDLNKNSKKTITYINDNIQDLPKGINEIEVETKSGTPTPIPEVKLDGPGCSIKEVHDVFNKHLLLQNTNSVDIVLATIVANRLPGASVWLFLVGPSGSGKSEILMSLGSTPEVESISSLTPHVLISGFARDDGKDPSLVARVNNRDVCIKDFTTLTGMNITSQQEIISTLRDCFDGNCSKPFGNGEDKKYKSKFGIIAGVTGIIDFFSENLTALGERFIRFDVQLDTSIVGERNVLFKIMSSISSGSKSSMQEELQEVMAKFLNYKFEFTFQPSIEKKEQIIALAQWTGLIRGSVIRDNRTGEILLKPMVEYSTRLTEQYYKLYIALHIINSFTEDNESIYDLLKEVAVSTVHKNNYNILRFIYEAKAGVDIQKVSEAIGLPTPTVKRHVENLTILRVLTKTKLEKIDGFGSTVTYTPSNRIKNLIYKSTII